MVTIEYVVRIDGQVTRTAVMASKFPKVGDNYYQRVNDELGSAIEGIDSYGLEFPIDQFLVLVSPDTVVWGAKSVTAVTNPDKLYQQEQIDKLVYKLQGGR